MQVGREELLRKLELVQPGLSDKELIEQSGCLVFTGGRVVTFNDEVSCRAPSSLNGVEGAVPAKKLLELLRKLTEDSLDLYEEEGRLIVKGKRKASGIRMEKEVLLAYKTVERPKKGDWRELDPEFLQAVEVVQHCATSDQSMPVLTCVHIHPKWLEACDDYQICRYRIKTGVERPVLVKRDHLKQVVALGVTQFAETPGWIHFRSDEVTVSCRRYLDEYKDVSAAFEVEGQDINLPKGLVEAAERAALFCEEDLVTVKIGPGRLRVESEDATGWYYESKKSTYAGPALEFLIPPGLLAELTKKYNACTVSDIKLKVTGEKWQYVTRLNAPGEGQPKEDDNADTTDDVGDAAVQSR